MISVPGQTLAHGNPIPKGMCGRRRVSNMAPFKNKVLKSVAQELKNLDRKIVLNSMILKWDNIKKEFEELINF